MPASNYAGNAVLDMLLRGVAFTPPVRVYVSLHTADPGPTGLHEVTTAQWPSYVRQDPSLGEDITTGFTVPDSKVSRNAKQMTFGTVDGTVEIVVTHSAVWDSFDSGNMLDYGKLEPPRTLAPTDVCVINPDKLTHTVL
jgi:hypothetical protein